MRGIALFVAGAAVGLAASAVAQNQSSNHGIVGINHVGIAVPDLDKAVEYYTKTMGFPEAFRIKNAAGQVQFVYVQVKPEYLPRAAARERRETAGHFSFWRGRRQPTGRGRDVQGTRRRCR